MIFEFLPHVAILPWKHWWIGCMDTHFCISSFLTDLLMPMADGSRRPIQNKVCHKTPIYLECYHPPHRGHARLRMQNQNADWIHLDELFFLLSWWFLLVLQWSVFQGFQYRFGSSVLRWPLRQAQRPHSHYRCGLRQAKGSGLRQAQSPPPWLVEVRVMAEPPVPELVERRWLKRDRAADKNHGYCLVQILPIQ